MDDIIQQLSSVNKNFTDMNRRLDCMETNISERLDDMDKRLIDMNNKFNDMEGKIDKFVDKITKINKIIADLEIKDSSNDFMVRSLNRRATSPDNEPVHLSSENHSYDNEPGDIVVMEIREPVQRGEGVLRIISAALWN